MKSVKFYFVVLLTIGSFTLLSSENDAKAVEHYLGDNLSTYRQIPYSLETETALAGSLNLSLTSVSYYPIALSGWTFSVHSDGISEDGYFAIVYRRRKSWSPASVPFQLKCGIDGLQISTVKVEDPTVYDPTIEIVRDGMLNYSQFMVTVPAKRAGYNDMLFEIKGTLYGVDVTLHFYLQLMSENM